MSPRTISFSKQRARPIGAAVLGACLSCAEVLGIPSDPELAVSPAVQDDPASRRGVAEKPWPAGVNDPAANGAPSPPRGDDRGAGSDGVLPPDSVASIDTSESRPAAPEPDAPLDGADAGSPDASVGLAPPGCDGPFERVPVDLVFIVDNSGSMSEETERFEQALPSFVALLDGDEVDYRIILLSRHRRDERSASAEASTSVCVAAPLSELAACPSARPALGPRFFQYSIKMDDDDSLQRVLQALDAPDPFGLTEIGWSEWLRSGALTIFIEITDADSALSANDFTTALQAAAPASFGSDATRPGFVFHSITGVIQKALEPSIYLADEPIEPAVCEGIGSNPDNAGVVYQELTRSTGGLRAPVCPADALGVRLEVLASDASLRSIGPCADPR
jgi:hypothetical protein